MKALDRQRNSSMAAAAPAVCKDRRHLLLLGMALAGVAIARRILHLPSRAPALNGSWLSRHEAAFYTTHATGD